MDNDKDIQQSKEAPAPAPKPRPVAAPPSDDMQLSENFKLGEFYVSDTYPALAKAIERTPEDAATLKELCVKIIQPIRDQLKKGIHINRGKASKELNDLVGGQETSQHLFAEAADLGVVNQDAWAVYQFVRFDSDIQKALGQCIIYINANNTVAHFVHVSLKTKRYGKGPMMLVKVDGDEKYYRYGVDRIPGIHY